MKVFEKNKIVADDLYDITSSTIDWSKFKGCTILISGGAGLLGSYIVKSFLFANEIYNLNLSIICITRSRKGINYRLKDWKKNDNMKIYVHDVVDELPDDFPSVQYIIHAASNASPVLYGTDPLGTISANTSGTEMLLKFAVKSKVKKFLFFSSGEVYGVTKDELLTEDNFGYINPLDIRSVYAESKRLGESLCSAYNKKYELDISIARPFHTYGPGIDFKDGRVFSDFVASIVNRNDIYMQSNGNVLRPFCYISDATIAFIKILSINNGFNAYNVSNPDAEISIKNLAKMLIEIFQDREISIVYKRNNPTNTYLESPIMRQIVSINKIRNLGWEPKIDLVEGFTKTVSSFFKENNI